MDPHGQHGVDALNLQGNLDNLKVSASDVASHQSCPRYLALKIRPDVRSSAWQRRYGSADTFVLGMIDQLVQVALQDNVADQPATLPAWIRQQLDVRGTHRLLRTYVETAVENLLDVHYEVVHELGDLKLIGSDPFIGRPPRILWVWAPMYGTESGVREIRRYRIGSAHHSPTESDMLWAETAARIAAGARGGVDPTRIRVIEVGAADASVAVLFDDIPNVAIQRFEANAKNVAAELGDFEIPDAGYDCPNCKVAGACEGLIATSDVLGQAEPGYATRSVSPSGLDRYRTCPGQWLLSTELHLPRSDESSEAQVRGILVHKWLEEAHTRGTGCTTADLPEPGQGLGLVAGLMTDDEYAVAYPFLRHHIATCPLSADGVEWLGVEESIRGYDESADVVTVTKPDLVFRIGERVVVREFKTAAAVPAQGADEMYRRHLQVPFLLSMLDSGVTQSLGAKDSTVEVEVLTPDGSVVYAWDAETPGLVDAARADVKSAVDRWHVDAAWETTPGHHCDWCPVRRWCPDRDAGLTASGEAAAAQRLSTLDPTADDDPPPF